VLDWLDPVGQELVHSAALRDDANVLDVAAGTGEPGISGTATVPSEQAGRVLWRGIRMYDRTRPSSQLRDQLDVQQLRGSVAIERWDGIAACIRAPKELHSLADPQPPRRPVKGAARACARRGGGVANP